MAEKSEKLVVKKLMATATKRVATHNVWIGEEFQDRHKSNKNMIWEIVPSRL